MSDHRLILAVSASMIPKNLFVGGFHSSNDVLPILREADTWFGPRNTLENLETHLQIIPYIVVVVGGKVVTYTRTPAGGEARLHGKVSFGLGGHIDLPDAVSAGNQFDIDGTIENAATREILEELGVEIRGMPIKHVGLIFDAETAVGRVHLGVVSILHLDDAPTSAEDEIGEVTLKTLDELANESRLETWSKILVPHLASLI